MSSQKVGDQVRSVRAGDRVYVNPARKCGNRGHLSQWAAAQLPELHVPGYFGRSQEIIKAYVYGGLCHDRAEDALVRLPDNVSYEAAARFGYLGPAYAGYEEPRRRSRGTPGERHQPLGLNAAMLALAMGAARILAPAATKRCSTV